MSSNQESDLGTEKIFPILDRRAPVIERIRERRRLRNSVGLSTGRKVGEFMLQEEGEERVLKAQEVASEFREGLSDELGVPSEAINDDLVDDFMALFAVLEEDDVVDMEMVESESGNVEGDGEGGLFNGDEE